MVRKANILILVKLPRWFSAAELFFDNRLGETELRFGIVNSTRSLRKRGVAIDSEKESICPG